MSQKDIESKYKRLRNKARKANRKLNKYQESIKDVCEHPDEYVYNYTEHDVCELCDAYRYYVHNNIVNTGSWGEWV